nr:DNA repair protein RecN [Halorhodospira abdelmalekii]
MREIHIRNFAIVEALDLELGAAMNVLTGETGAGKSILLDALGLCLGDRASAETIRPGANKAEITALFLVPPNAPAAVWLRDHDLSEHHADTPLPSTESPAATEPSAPPPEALHEEIIVRRVIHSNSRSRGFINSTPVPLQMLRTLGEHLIDIHGQHAHQSLLRPAAQRVLLDAYAETEPQRCTVADLYEQLRTIDSELAELVTDEHTYEDRLALLQHQIAELAEAAPTPEGLLELEREHQRLAHADELIGIAHTHLEALYDADYSAQAALGRAQRELSEYEQLAAALHQARELFDGALAHLEEGCQVLRGFTDSLESDPQQLAAIEQRIGLLRDLARKHRVETAELPATLERLQAELARLENAETRIAALRSERERLESDYRGAAHQLSQQRSKAAVALVSAVEALLGELGMAGTEVRIAVTHQAEATPTPHGLDRVELQVRTNPGQPLAPLSRIASGGELSRLGLALQVATVARADSAPTLVFDEADSGIGGAVAEVVGRLLHTLGERYQVLCVTHLPQVAAQASTHFHVAKEQSAETTRARVSALDQTARIEEIARMLGGLQIGADERAAARKLLGGYSAAAPRKRPRGTNKRP